MMIHAITTYQCTTYLEREMSLLPLSTSCASVVMLVMTHDDVVRPPSLSIFPPCVMWVNLTCKKEKERVKIKC